jgi:hypothetical protein
VLIGAVLAGSALVAATVTAQESQSSRKPVRVVAPERIAVAAGGQRAALAAYLSASLDNVRPEVTRAVIVFHGIRRDADVYYDGALQARAAAGQEAASSLMIAPQFLSDADATAHRLADDILVWQDSSWSGGADAVAPAPVSSFAAVDAMLLRFADTTRFPNLAQVVLAGHSGGGQIVQRYAVVGKAEGVLAARGVHVRYVIANPSSYVYFTPQRPGPDGRLIPFAAAACPNYDHWKYGFAAGVPPYVDADAAVYEAHYAARDVVYLLGTNDTDPNHPALDRSCMGEAEGPHRYARGHWYFAGLQAQLGARLVHKIHDVAGVAHSGVAMFTSPCGLAALFDRDGCPVP